MTDVGKFLDEEAMGYNISIVGRNVHVTEAMKNYAWGKLSKIERFHKHIIDCHVNLDIQKLEHSVVIIYMFNGIKIKVSASSTDMYASIDKAVDKLQAKLRRWKSRMQDYNSKKGVDAVDIEVNVIRRPAHYDEVDDINAQIEREQKEAVETALHPHLIGSETRPLKILTTDEAIMKLELAGEEVVVFRDEVDQKLKVLYRREDGDYGLIKPE